MIYLHTFVVGGLILGVGAVRPAATVTPQPTKFLAGNHWALLLTLPTAPIQHHQPSALTKKICWDQAPIHKPLEKPQELKVHVNHRKKWGTGQKNIGCSLQKYNFGLFMVIAPTFRGVGEGGGKHARLRGKGGSSKGAKRESATRNGNWMWRVTDTSYRKDKENKKTRQLCGDQ